MTFDPTLTAGVALQIIVMVVALIVGWSKLDARLQAFAINLEHHARAIESHTRRLDAIDQRLVSVIADLQRLIGRSEHLTQYGGDFTSLKNEPPR